MSDFLNRKEVPLPKRRRKIQIKYRDNGEHILKCIWQPFNPKNYSDANMPSEGYLGTARNIKTKVGYHAWGPVDSEFLYYKLGH